MMSGWSACMGGVALVKRKRRLTDMVQHASRTQCEVCGRRTAASWLANKKGRGLSAGAGVDGAENNKRAKTLAPSDPMLAQPTDGVSFARWLSKMDAATVNLAAGGLLTACGGDGVANRMIKRGGVEAVAQKTMTAKRLSFFQLPNTTETTGRCEQKPMHLPIYRTKRTRHVKMTGRGLADAPPGRTRHRKRGRPGYPNGKKKGERFGFSFCQGSGMRWDARGRKG